MTAEQYICIFDARLLQTLSIFPDDFDKCILNRAVKLYSMTYNKAKINMLNMWFPKKSMTAV